MRSFLLEHVYFQHVLHRSVTLAASRQPGGEQLSTDHGAAKL